MISIVMRYKVTISVILVLAFLLYCWNAGRGYDDTAMASIPEYSDLDENSILEQEDISSKLEPSYLKYAAKNDQEGAADPEGFSRTIDSMNFSAVSDAGTKVEENLGGQSGRVLALTEESSWVEYTFDVPEDGNYQMGMSYYALKGKRASVVRAVKLDGAYPFFQAKKLEFKRMWKEVGEPWYDNQGNEFNPRREEVSGWQYREFQDTEARVQEPFRFHLTKGRHTLRIEAIREPAAIGQITIHSPAQTPAYEDVAKTYEEKGYRAAGQDVQIKIQAENAVLRSDPTLQRVEDREPITEPFNKNAIVLNTFGGAAWKLGGQWAEWEFEVPESGLYEMGARYGQWFLNGFPTQRKVTIDGELAFREMNAVNFPYSHTWEIAKFGDDGKPYQFYLEKGKHKVRMEVQVGALGEVLEKVTDTTHNISLLSREVIRVTGTNPDPNGDWRLEENIPNLIPRLHLLAKSFDDAIQQLYKLGVKEGSSDISTLYEARDQMISMADKTASIPARLQAITDLQSSLGLWVNGLTKQSLLLDYLIVQTPGHEWPKAEAPVYVRAWTAVRDFSQSFTKDYGGVGNVYDNQETLDIWVARGRDWVQIIKQMIDEDFTPQTGIKVNVNVVPANQTQVLLLANTAGLAPDVALGVEGEVPIDFAVRDGLVNLRDFPDYEDVAKRFRPGALIPYKYNGGDYALPENQNFYMLFYRKDIMEQLGIAEDQIPETWDEVKALIPELQQNGMDFFYPHAANNPNLAINEFAPFLFQSKGDFYKEDGKESSLDEPQALSAMKLWTDLFTNYKIQKQADFYNRFRSGEMPIGVADYSTYILLSTAAPELTGWWGMKPIPGIRQEDGQINRSTGGLGQTGIIFKESTKKEEAWEFLKWWTSADSQERFGTELESLLGVEARWNTANVEALKRMPWQKEDIDAILEQWDWFREREIVLGGYYTTRYIANMWNEIVLNGKNIREAVEEGVREIDKELRKKREEFGLDRITDEAGKEGEDQP
ncbi:ABC-type glycerol-3-phosphate transport system substrate-binding protein [Paenibacillus rhizosphaerae]|uniref:ABC-type glycerol-3-phosphate transport system substrate-binding protein n=1 Tax=Paenibacillus rhizosphaerae TaxID=297318 RepID=A0A839TXC1_9BACL|nr:extracellular solute-binding protein [Paenibacillus rhizosphaerae]MBB3131143.1 ABC-type glycerol-3-phosphate transport system substrate-binding protein [Paenibacillus rhizosphaerae]